MKQLLTITALLFSVTIFGQKWKNWKSADDIKVKDLAEFKYANDSIYVSNFSWMVIMPQLGKKTKYYQIDIPEVLSVSGNVDTLEIKSKDIKFIKVDGKVYEIKRTTELKEVVDNYGYKGRIYSPSNSTIYYDGMGLAAPAILPLIDTPKVSTIDTASFNSLIRWSDTTWYITKYKKRNILDSLSKIKKPVKKVVKKPTSSINKPRRIVGQTYALLGFIGASDTITMCACNLKDCADYKRPERIRALIKDNTTYTIALMKTFGIDAEKARQAAQLRYPISK